MAEDERPWAIIIVSAPLHPHAVFDMSPAVRIPMWPTEEYAIRDFKSD